MHTVRVAPRRHASAAVLCLSWQIDCVSNRNRYRDTRVGNFIFFLLRFTLQNHIRFQKTLTLDNNEQLFIFGSWSRYHTFIPIPRFLKHLAINISAESHRIKIYQSIRATHRNPVVNFKFFLGWFFLNLVSFSIYTGYPQWFLMIWQLQDSYTLYNALIQTLLCPN